jgi:glycosyltransferase involved in cell wall biosynthesis
VHNYRHVCAPGVFFRDGHLCTDCKGRAFALPAIRHACYRGSRPQSAIMATALAAHRGTWRSVDRYIALTSGIHRYLTEYGIPAERITIKPNGIPDPGWAAVEPGDGFLFAARLSPEKGLAVLLEAWRRHPDGAFGPLRIAGDGPLRDLAESASAERGDVVYLGPLDATGVRAQIRSAACVLAPSLWHDVLPTIVIEALAGGRPALGTTLGGTPYLVGVDDPDGAAGWAVPPTADGLAAGLATAHGSAAGLGKAARSRYERLFAPEVSVRRLIEIYGEVIR